MGDKKEESKQAFTMDIIVTGTAPVIAQDGKPITEQEALVEILNRLDRIEKKL